MTRPLGKRGRLEAFQRHPPERRVPQRERVWLRRWRRYGNVWMFNHFCTSQGLPRGPRTIFIDPCQPYNRPMPAL
jgi:hypothetical protein